MQRCPGLVIIRPAMEKYRAASRLILAIYHDCTDLVEPLSLDEAYLDVSNSSHCKGSATLIAQQIRERIAQTVGITASAGIPPNKFLAKIASDWNKPNGQFAVLPQHIGAFVAELPLVMWQAPESDSQRRRKIFSCVMNKSWPFGHVSIRHCCRTLKTPSA